MIGPIAEEYYTFDIDSEEENFIVNDIFEELGQAMGDKNPSMFSDEQMKEILDKWIGQTNTRDTIENIKLLLNFSLEG